MEMSREQYKELMGLEEGDSGLEYADEVVTNENWWELAKSATATTSMLLEEDVKMLDNEMLKKVLATLTAYKLTNEGCLSNEKEADLDKQISAVYDAVMDTRMIGEALK